MTLTVHVFEGKLVLWVKVQQYISGTRYLMCLQTRVQYIYMELYRFQTRRLHTNTLADLLPLHPQLREHWTP